MEMAVLSLKDICRLTLTQCIVREDSSCMNSDLQWVYLIRLLDHGSWGDQSKEILDRVVEYYGDKLTPRILEALLPCSAKEITLKECPKVTEQSLNMIISRCSHLQSLDVTENTHLEFDKVQLFQSCGKATPNQLTTLVLEDCPQVTDEEIQAVLKNAPSLQTLNIARCSITDKVFLINETKQLAREAHLQLPRCTDDYDSKLHTVDVSRCKHFSSTGVRHLCTLCGPSLSSVNLSWTKVDCTSFVFLSGYGLPAAVQFYLSLDFLGKPIVEAMLHMLQDFDVISQQITDQWSSNLQENNSKTPPDSHSVNVNNVTGAQNLHGKCSAEAEGIKFEQIHGMASTVCDVACRSEDSHPSEHSSIEMNTASCANFPSQQNIPTALENNDLINKDTWLSTDPNGNPAVESAKTVSSTNDVPEKLVRGNSEHGLARSVTFSKEEGGGEIIQVSGDECGIVSEESIVCDFGDIVMLTDDGQSVIVDMRTNAQSAGNTSDTYSQSLCLSEPADSGVEDGSFMGSENSQNSSQVLESFVRDSNASRLDVHESGVSQGGEGAESEENNCRKLKYPAVCVEEGSTNVKSHITDSQNEITSEPANALVSHDSADASELCDVSSSMTQSALFSAKEVTLSGCNEKTTCDKTAANHVPSDRSETHAPSKSFTLTNQQARKEPFFTPKLTSLSINGIVFEDEHMGLECFRKFLMTNQLSVLKLFGGLTGNFVSDNVLEVVGNHGQCLTTIAMEGCDHVTSVGITHLTKCKQLTDIDLTGVAFVDDPGIVMLGYNHLLSRILLAETQITSAALNVIVSRPSAPQLKELDLSWCEDMDDDSGLNNIVSTCSCLERLMLRECIGLTTTTLGLLAENCHLITELSIASNMNIVQDESVIMLSENMPLLEKIDLGWNTHLTDQSICALMANCTCLKYANLEGLKLITSAAFVGIIAVPDLLTDFIANIVSQCNEDSPTYNVVLKISDLPCLPQRSTVYCTELRTLHLKYSDYVEDDRLQEIVAITQGSVKVIDYYGEEVEEMPHAIERFVNRLI